MLNRNIEKEAVLSKTNGKCAYCGCPITLSTMTIDHVEPIVRPLVRKNGTLSTRNIKGTPEQEDISNKLPACRSCNSYKSSLSLESFRERIEHWPNVLESNNSVVRAMIRFDLLDLHRKPVVFYFEKLNEGDSSVG